MERCLHDPAFGYYGSGRVRFGASKHFWTYAQRLRPVFGWMVAEVARSVFEALAAEPGDELTILEFGGGEGDLARDVIEYVLDRSRSPEWSPFAARLRYVLVERSTALRECQAARLGPYLESGKVRIVGGDATTFQWQGPFHGLVVLNEVLTAFSCERLVLHGSGDARRLHVVPRLPDEASVPRPLDEDGFWKLISDRAWEDRGGTFNELEVPLALGWLDPEGRAGPVPADLLEYLETLEPLLGDLEACGLLPVELNWSPQVRQFTERLSSLIARGADRIGGALIIDYGGTSRHVLDPRLTGSHFRVYGGLRLYDHKPLPYIAPGEYDMTWDADFTELERLAAERELSLAFFGHQSALEAPPVNLESPAAKRELIRGRLDEGEEDLEDAAEEARELVASFREAPGFRVFVLTGSDLPLSLDRLGVSDHVSGEGLRTLSPQALPEDIAQALASAGLPRAAAGCLKPCGDPVADLGDRRMHRYRREVLAVLEEKGWLVEPGRI